jgi:hypothetical protein
LIFSIRLTVCRTGASWAKNPDLSVQRKHLRGQVLVHDRRLIARLDEQIGREQTARRFLKDHASFIARRKNSN